MLWKVDHWRVRRHPDRNGGEHTCKGEEEHFAVRLRNAEPVPRRLALV